MNENGDDQNHDSIDKIINHDFQNQEDAVPGILADFWMETQEHLDKIELNILTLETNFRNMEIIHALLREFHTIKGLAGFVNHELIQRIAHQIETRLDDCRKGVCEANPEVIDLILTASDYIKRFCENPSLSQDPEFTDSIETYLNKLDILSAGMSLTKLPETDVSGDPGLSPDTETTIPDDSIDSNDLPINSDFSSKIETFMPGDPVPNVDISMNINAATSITAIMNINEVLNTSPKIDDLAPGESGEAISEENEAPAQNDSFAEVDALVKQIQAPDEQSSILTENEAEYLKTFIDETRSYSDIFEQALLQFEKEPQNKGFVNEMFRSMHTIKGMASAMGYVNLTALTHGIENLLQEIRDNQITASPQLLEILFIGHDHLTDSVEFIIRTGKEAELNKEGYLDQLREILSQMRKNRTEDLTPGNGVTPGTQDKSETPSPELGLDPDFVQETGAIILEWVTQIELKVLLLETSPEDSALILSIYDYLQIINRLACLIADELVRNLTRQAAVLLKKYAGKEMRINRTLIDWLLLSLDYIKKLGSRSQFNDQGLREISVAINAHLSQFPVRDSELTDIDTETLEGTPIQKLGNILIEQKKLTLAEVTELLAKQKADEPELRLGQIGVKEGKIEAGTLQESLKIQQQSIINHTPVIRESESGTKDKRFDALPQIHDPAPTSGQPVLKIGEILVAQNVISSDELEGLLAQQKAHPGLKLGQVAVAEKKAEPNEIIQSLRAQEHEFKAINAENYNVRVSISKVDNLVDMVGELLIIQSLIEQEAGQRFDNNDYFMTNLVRMARITKDIQNMSMSLRMISLKSTFQKINRVARDAINQLSKNISFEITGEETEIDRGVAEKILDPLIHLVKNAISHGIEPESARTSRGKPAQGLVKVEASSKRGYIFIDVSDDGKGMDIDAIRRKALEKNLIEPGVNYTTDEIFNLVFLPGFSTAEVIDNISGRGVGLDVVKTEMQKIGGKVAINSRPGQGSVFTLKIPINFAVFNGIIISIKDRNFIIPSQNVIRIVRIQPDQWVEASGKKLITLRDEAFPVIPIFNALGLNDPESAKLVVVLELDQNIKALPVHGITGKREIVLKPLGNEFSDLQWIAGASILGDGKVSLILDIENIFKMEEDVG
ncbi:MAG TPA: Hpt domain-containing protein [Bacillota bacterium]|nr:Hpt domain-containing protein [Bacillota bacterium]